MPSSSSNAAVTRRPALRAAVVLALAAGLAATTVAAPVARASERAPSAEQLTAQRNEAGRLQAEIGQREAAVTQARARLAELAQQAGAALEAYRTALHARDAADAERLVQEERLAAARVVLAASRGDLGRWASQAYRDGGAMADYEALMTLLESENSDDLGQRLSMLRVVGRVKGGVLATTRDAEAVQDDATTRSRKAAWAASEAAAAAETARADADRLLAEQRDQLAALDALLAQTVDAAAAAAARAEQMASARAVAEQRRLEAEAARRAQSNVVTGVVGQCAGGEVSRYPNGAIPLSALCPLWGAPGHYLRADAAHAFGQLTEAYAAQHGQPLCVGDSYRPLDSQVQLYATKPGLAAVPGTSNHGWGTAVDLCGGVESFGTREHEWMRANAPLHGWFHPAWAQQGGSRPEPWHWEFGG
jgi:septal ring factor EnvC (AmiA/AmiB activator)